MRLPSTVASLLETVASWGRHGAVLRGLIVVAAVVSIVTTAAVGEVSVFGVGLVVAATLFTVSRPDSSAPLLLIVLLLTQWYAGVSPALPRWSIVPALAVLVIHAAAARASVVPRRAEVDAAATRRWLLHVGIVAWLTATLWALTVVFDGIAGSGTVAVSVIALGFVVALGLVLILREVAHHEGPQRSSTT